MADRPIPGSDSGTWGEKLNAHLDVVLKTDGSLRAPDPLTYSLGSAASAGANSIVFERAAPVGLRRSQIMAIDPFTTNCELKTVSSVTGSTVALASTLKFAHSNGAGVIFLTSRDAPAAWFGATADGSDDADALRHGMDETQRESVWLEGMNKSYRVGKPFAALNGTKLKNFEILPHSTYAPIDANNAMLMNTGGAKRTFTATAVDDTFTTDVHALAIDQGLVFYGSSLPTGLTAGRYYYAIPVDTTKFKVAATIGGTAVDLTSDGSGDVYTKVYNITGSLYLDNFRLDGDSKTGLNAVLMAAQQPGFWRKVYIENFGGWGARLRGQDYKFENTVVIRCGRGIVMDGIGFCDWFGTNVESINVTGTDKIGIDFTLDDGLYIATGSSIAHRFFGLHFESCEVAAIRMSRGDAVFDGIIINTATGAPLMLCNGAISQTRYTFRHVWWAGDSDTAQAIDDSARGWTGADVLMERAHFGRKIDLFVAPNDTSGIPTPPTSMWAGIGKGYIRMGTAAVDYSMMETRVPSGQTVDFWRHFDSAGVETFAITKDGWVQIGEGAPIKKVLSATSTYDPPSTLADAMWSTTITVTGATVSNSVAHASHSSIVAAGWVLSASVTAADTVTVTGFNKTGGTVDLASGTLRVVVEQF